MNHHNDQDALTLQLLMNSNNSVSQVNEQKENNKTLNFLPPSNSKQFSLYDMNVTRLTHQHEESQRKYNMWLKKRQEQNVETLKKDIESKKKNEMNFDLDYWKKKFLYPYALDTGPLKASAGENAITSEDVVNQNNILEKLGKNNQFNILDTNAL